MSVRGVPQLKRLLLRYSDLDGSSRGVREFIATQLVPLAEQYPHITINTGVVRNKHPFVRAEYLEGRSRTIDLRNRDTEEIAEFLKYLRNTSGRRVTEPLKKPIITRQQTIQGFWSPEVSMHQLEFKLEHKM